MVVVCVGFLSVVNSVCVLASARGCWSLNYVSILVVGGVGLTCVLLCRNSSLSFG